jgi:hypothetical protein
MKSRLLPLVAYSILLSLSLPSPARADDKPAKAASGEAENKKNVTVLVLAAKPEAVHGAALQALASVGCEVKKDTPTAIEGKRSNKIGLAVGSGGEKLFVEIKDLGDGKTELKVTTKKTMLGIVGQKLWNEEVANQIKDAVK